MWIAIGGGLLLIMVLVVGITVATNQNHEKWKQAADTLGLTYDGADKVGKLHMSGSIDGLPIEVKLDKRGTGEMARTWTQVRVTAGLTNRVYIDSDVERNPILRLEAALAEQVEIGDAELDENVRIQGDDDAVHRLFDAESRAAMKKAIGVARVRIAEGDVFLEHLDLVREPDVLVKTTREAVALTKVLQQTQVR